MNPFTLTICKDLAEARGACVDGAVYKAAGIDLVDRLKERKESLPQLVDIGRLRKDLGGITIDAQSLRLGALTTLHEIAEHENTASRALRALREAAGEAATPQVRRRATLGGNLLQRARCWYLRSAGIGCSHGGDGPTCMAREGENRYHAIFGGFDCVRVHPSNCATALCVLGAEAEIQSGDATRRIPIRALWPEHGLAALPEHTLEPGELLIAVHIGRDVIEGNSAYREAREKASFDWPTTSAAVHVAIEDGVIRAARIALGAVAPVPWPCDDAAKSLIGKPPSDELFASAARAAFKDAQALTHNAYKIEQGQAVLIDALRAACAEV
ncbi:MAG: FAD binding domain-containing protein [Planctomycetes bacterium]|nr:FAD binding domain-containing protein [Planctomycetota bacterium]